MCLFRQCNSLSLCYRSTYVSHQAIFSVNSGMGQTLQMSCARDLPTSDPATLHEPCACLSKMFVSALADVCVGGGISWLAKSSLTTASQATIEMIKATIHLGSFWSGKVGAIIS